MTTRASIILWSAGSGALLGLFVDAMVVGLWMVASSVAPSIAPRQFPRWLSGMALALLVAIPIVAATLGYLEGRLKLD